MAVCETIQKRLLAYLFDLLEGEEKKEVEEHLKSCPNCWRDLEKLKQVQTAVAREPLARAPIQLPEILKRAREIEQKKQIRNVYQFLFLSRVLDLVRKNVFLKSGLALAVLLFFFLFTWPFFKPGEKLYVQKARGEVYVGQESFFKRCLDEYDLRHTLNLRTGDGEFIAQINHDKLLIMEGDTELSVTDQKAVEVVLKQGTLVARMRERPQGKKWIIATSRARFEITGTVFYVKAAKDQVECGVQKGTVKSTVSNRSYFIRSRDKIRIVNNQAEVSRLSDENKIFEKLALYPLRKDFKNVEKIVIKTKPEKSEIFWKNMWLGQSPLFMLAEKEQVKSLTIMQQGYISQEFDLSAKKEYTILLVKQGDPEIAWSLKMNNRTFYNPVHKDGHLLVSDETGWLYKIKVMTKKEIWKFKMGKRNDSTPIIMDDIIYVSSNDEYLYAVLFQTGKLLWKKKIGILVYSMPQALGDKLYVCNNEGILYCLNKKDGAIIWARGVDRGIYASPVIYEGNLYIGGISGTFYSIDLKQGGKNWEFRTGNRIVGSTPLIIRDKIYFGSNDRCLYALSLKTGRLLWKLDTKGEIFTAPVQLDEKIVIGNVKGSLFCVEPENGKVLWRNELGEKILLNPALSRARYLIIVTDMTIYVLNRWGLFFTKYVYSTTGFTLAENKDIYVCGQDGYLKSINFRLE